MRPRWRTAAVCAAVACAVLLTGSRVWAQPEPLVAVHVSELTRALETTPARPPTPSGTRSTTGYEWWPSVWWYFTIPESLQEALRSDGTPFVEISDADITAGLLRRSDGSPRYPILISLAAEAIADSEIGPLRDYVAAGGFLFVGSSAFTRNPDGTTRGNFALSEEMGLRMASTTLQNWYENRRFTRVVDHRLLSGIPAGTVYWRMPHDSEEVPLGLSPSHSVPRGSHYTFSVVSTGATVLANGDSGPLVATRPHGAGQFIYHGAMQPLIGHSVYDPATYAYLIYRHAIEWAFEAADVPLVRLAPWPFSYNAALIVRHDFENAASSIRAIEPSASFEEALGVRGDYYFCTGTLRQEMSDRDAVVQSLRRAVTNSGASIGSHNGGLKNPVNLSLSMSSFDYWHWGPDEALNVTPPGYSSGKAYARDSVLRSFHDIEGWLDGVDNGRPGCGSAGNCPRLWSAPYFNATRENSYDLLNSLGTLASGGGEQKIGPFPHWTLSYRTPGKRYVLSLPLSDWYVGSDIPGALDMGHTSQSMRAAVDFYETLGATINLYGHQPSTDTSLMGDYVRYAAAKRRMWRANTALIADWWALRSDVTIAPTFTLANGAATIRTGIAGTTDPDISIDVSLPGVDTYDVLIDGAPADPRDYRVVGSAIRVRAGAASFVDVRYGASNPVPTTTGLLPASAIAGGPAFTLTVNGGGFVDGSLVRWNGANRTTTYVSATELRAAIPAGDIASDGTATVTVFTPAPGGGTSNAQTFTITTNAGSGWTQTDWSGGSGQVVWADSTRYQSATDIDDSTAGQIALATNAQQLFADDFTRPVGTADPLSPWVGVMGTWSVADGVLRGSGSARQYSYARPALGDAWTDYTVQARIQVPAGAFGGGLGARVNASTGAHYGAWVYPTGSSGGSNVLKLWKFRTWTDLGPGVAMRQVSVPPVGTSPHTLRLTMTGSRIQVFYDGSLMIDVTDSNFDGRAPYLSGGISADWWTGYPVQTLTVDDVSVTGAAAYAATGALVSSAFDGGASASWADVTWQSLASGGASVCVRTRTADAQDDLATAPWSACYAGSGSGFLSDQRRWIQYRVELTAGADSTPIFREITIPFTSTENPVPTTSGIEPVSAVAGSGALTLTVNGGDFVPGSIVRWNGSDRVTTYVSATELTAAIPATDVAVSGTASVTVYSPAPGGGTSNPQTFTITSANNPVPATTSLNPSSIAAGSAGFTLTVTGTGFVSGSLVRWNGSNRTTTYVSATQVTAAIPATDVTVSGTASVTVYSPAPGGGTSNAQTFTITSANNPVPTTTSLNPSSIAAGSAGFTLTVAGTGFVSGSLVRWNGSNRTTTYVSATQVTAAIPATDVTVSGTASVTVYSPAPGGGISNAQAFTISEADNPIPTTTGIEPSSAAAGSPAFTLTVTGTGFVSGSLVRWNGNTRITTYVSTTQLTAAIVATDVAEAGTASVTVYSPAPGGGTSNAQTFTITTAGNPVPTTTSLSPASAVAGSSGFTLTVNGTGFVAASVVRWNGTDRTTTFVSTVQLTAAIAASDIAAAGTASVDVLSPAPGGGTSNAQTFTIGSSSVLFSDDFTRAPDVPDPLQPWAAAMGSWSVSGGVMRGTGLSRQYSYARLAASPEWGDYAVEAKIQLPSGAFGGGVGGRLNAATGAHYGAWLYPSGSAGGSNLLKLWKFRGWTDIGAGVPMRQVAVPNVGTGPHVMKLVFVGSRVRVYYDGVLMIDVSDDNFDGRAPLLTGGISADWWTGYPAGTIIVDDVLVTTP